MFSTVLRHGVSFASGLLVAFAIFKMRRRARAPIQTSFPKKPVPVDTSEQKMVMAVRSDLRMGKGKIGAQCGHAAIGAYQEASVQQPHRVAAWEESGQMKIVVQAKDEGELLALQQEAKKRGLITCLIHDAGRTQIPAGTATVLAVGPGPASLVDEVTGSCKLL